MRALPFAILVSLAIGCIGHADTDQLTIGRRHLRVVPCGSEPSIAGVAGVNAHDPRAAFLSDWIIVSVCHLDVLMKQAEAEQQPLALFIQGKDFDNPPAGVDFESGQVTFILGRNVRNKDNWHPLLYDPLFEPTISLHVSAGIKGGRPLPRAPGANATIVLTKLYIDWTTWVWLALLLIIVIALLAFARNSDLLRDGPAVAGERQPYSVARVQMAWWFFLTIVGYSYIWMVTGDNDTIAPSLLALMGISAATAVTAVAMTPRKARFDARRRILDDEIAALDDAIAQIVIDLDAAATRGNAELQTVLGRKRDEIEKRRNVLIVERDSITSVAASNGFWRDLVTDDRGAVALDRFQIVAWTAILGGIFVQSVVWDLTMPEFSGTMLALMGISSGTYIGFKLPQKSG